MIYRDFNHWFTESTVHGCSSASRDWLRELWDDLKPTIEASHDDYKRMYIELAKEEKLNRSELVDKLIEYSDQFSRPDAPNFWRWWLNQEIK